MLSHDKLWIRRYVTLRTLIIIASVVILAVHIFESLFLEFFLSFWTGVPGDYDIESYSTVLSYPTAAALIAIFFGFVMTNASKSGLAQKESVTG